MISMSKCSTNILKWLTSSMTFWLVTQVWPITLTTPLHSGTSSRGTAICIPSHRDTDRKPILCWLYWSHLRFPLLRQAQASAVKKVHRPSLNHLKGRVGKPVSVISWASRRGQRCNNEHPLWAAHTVALYLREFDHEHEHEHFQSHQYKCDTVSVVGAIFVW